VKFNLERAAVIGLAAVIAAGIFFRLYHADWKVYSFDETATSIRASGHTFAEFGAFVHDGGTHRFTELSRFQAIDRSTDSAAVWSSLEAEDPQHPPLYFLITRYAEEATGDSVFLRRLPAAAFGIIGLLAGFWFAQELFGDRIVALCFAALVAVAPFHVVYAQQAREYSLWTLLIFISSSLLLRAIRTGRAGWLVLYAIAASLGLWNFTLFALVLVSHIVYVLVPVSGASPRSRRLVLCAVALSVASFSPWIVVLITRSGVAVQDTTWTSAPLSPLLFAGKWVFNASSVFFDLDYLSLALVPIAVVLLGVAVWCCVVLARKAPMRALSFVLLLGIMPAMQSRYLTPLWIALEAGTAFGLVTGCRSSIRRVRVRWCFSALAIFAAGVISCAVSSFAHSWWLANNDKTIPGIALELAREAHPMLVYVDEDTELLELAAAGVSDATFDLHKRLDSVGGSAAQSFVLTRDALAALAPGAPRLSPAPQIDLFPSGADPVISLLRRRAAKDRLEAVSGAPILFRIL
jgi:uncharacterized membrane protein